MFLTYTLSVLLFIYRDAHAIPVPYTPSSNVTSLLWNSGMLAAIDPPNQRQPPRTLFGVAWSCILTVFICAWTSVHPNVPPRGRMGGLLARVKMMFWTIVAPELVLAWAVRQWFAAREIRDVCNWHLGNGRMKLWTTAHGHFLQMGGFTLVSDKIDQFKEQDPPGWMSTPADWDSYNESVRQRELCQFGTLTLERFKELVRDRNITLPAITPAQIQDRSKGDGLSKLLAILQTSWFILQCIARGSQGLALTELELVTLAMASLNAITYIFWWNKPLGVQEPVNVYVTERGGVMEEKVDRSEEAEDVILYKAWGIIKSTMRAFEPSILNTLWSPCLCCFCMCRVGKISMVFPAMPAFGLCYLATYPVFILFPLGILILLWTIKTEKVEKMRDDETVAARVVLNLRKLRYNLTYSIRQYFGGSDGPLEYIWHDFDIFNDYDMLSYYLAWFFFIPACFFLLVLVLVILSPLFALFLIASFIFTAAFEIITTNKVPPGATHVPPFYAPRTDSDKYSRMVIFAIFGVIFGSIHCIAWNFYFPTHTERSLWRYTSLVLTAIPLVVAPLDYISENFNLDSRVGKRFRLVLGTFISVLLLFYVPARLCLIGQALALLRKQPPSAYIAVNWTKYIPHLFSNNYFLQWSAKQLEIGYHLLIMQSLWASHPLDASQ